MRAQDYIDDLQKRLKTGQAREHAYRPALQGLLESVIPNVTVLNDPARVDCGAPDFIISRKKIDLGYVEAKIPGENLDKVEKSEQMKRYFGSLDNLILTDYLEFRFYIRGERVDSIKLGRIEGTTITPDRTKFDRFHDLLLQFGAFEGQTITSARKLAGLMAHKTRLMQHIFNMAVRTSDEGDALYDQYLAFQSVLVHDMDIAQFADVYAQTICYGLFTARLHDETLEDFSREEALRLIPKSNPFLRQLFHYVAGPDLDPRVDWIVDALCDLFRATDLNAILRDFGAATGQNDPILHFYETFLAEYDRSLRKSRGVWYTPEPVVNFIVRAVDDVLKTHFGLADGLADTGKTSIKVPAQEPDKRTTTGRKMVDRDVHKVQVLDIATGTGTFLAEAVKQVYVRFKGQEGLWPSYVEEDLLPRLHGFELLMASYAMCHMKLDLLLRETGYDFARSHKQQRLGVYLTNALEEDHKDAHLPFTNWLSNEANQANEIKRDMPIMVAMGNPPYSGESVNKNDWIMSLMDAYKQEPGGGKLQERNSKWLNDDYVKFIRMGEHYITKNGEGVLAYITNHAYLDNPTFRGMRYHLLQSFDDIYVIDLHGNAKKKEVTPEGKPDRNVFDIQQGVAILIAVKREVANNQLASVHHAELWGERATKYEALAQNSLQSIDWNTLELVHPEYFFVPRNNELLKEYNFGFSLHNLMHSYGAGMTTARDHFVISESTETLIQNAESFRSSNLSNFDLCKYLNISQKSGWDITNARKTLRQEDNLEQFIQPVTYRPFDNRKIFYHDALVWRTVRKIMHHFIETNNLGLIVPKQAMEEPGGFLTKNIIAHKTYSAYNINYLFPLYLYQSDLDGIETKVPNLDETIYAQIQERVPDVTPESLFDYIYAVLHAPQYRQRYAEFLKSDFPRIPYPCDSATFHTLADKGGALRALHLMEDARLDSFITTFPVSGDHIVEKPRFEAHTDNPDTGRVYINESEYFDHVPKIAWEFYIGGYQPAQKWLKDRKGRALTRDDLMHYQRIITALTETDRIMREIETIDFLPMEK